MRWIEKAHLIGNRIKGRIYNRVQFCGHQFATRWSGFHLLETSYLSSLLFWSAKSDNGPTLSIWDDKLSSGGDLWLQLPPTLTHPPWCFVKTDSCAWSFISYDLPKTCIDTFAYMCMHTQMQKYIMAKIQAYMHTYYGLKWSQWVSLLYFSLALRPHYLTEVGLGALLSSLPWRGTIWNCCKNNNSTCIIHTQIHNILPNIYFSVFLFLFLGVSLVPPSKPAVSLVSDTSVQLMWSIGQSEGLNVTLFKVQFKEIKTRKHRKSAGWHTIDEDIAPDVSEFTVSSLKPGLLNN